MQKKNVALAVAVLALLNELFSRWGMKAVAIHSPLLWLLVMTDVLALADKIEREGLVEVLVKMIAFAFWAVVGVVGLSIALVLMLL